MTELTILMPCLNEARTLGKCIAMARDYLIRSGVDGEILIADNGSNDGSKTLAIAAGARVVDVQTRGYGAALLAGIAAARGKYIIMGDSDESYDFRNLDGFVDQLRAGFDLVMGNRFAGGIAPGAMPLLHRYLGNPVLTAIGRLLFRSPCKDFHCGLRGFRKDAINELHLQSLGMEFASEMVVKASINKLRITEIPTTLSPDGRDRPPHLRSWRDGWRHLRFLLLFSPRSVFLYPGVVLFLVSLLSGLYLLPRPRTIGAVTFDIHTLQFMAAGILVGAQSISFWVFAKAYAIREGFLPRDPFFERALSILTVEVTLIVGLCLILSGVMLSIVAVGGWIFADFGPLRPEEEMRLVIPAVTIIALGFQIIYSGFLLGILGTRIYTKERTLNAPNL